MFSETKERQLSDCVSCNVLANQTAEFNQDSFPATD